MFGVAAEAEDAVQEIFIELWKSADRYNPELAAESTFVAMVARRRLIDQRRRVERRVAQAPTTPVEDIDLPADVPQNDPLVVADEVSRATEAIRTLPPDQQRVLRLAVCDGWPHQQIADYLKIPLGTVKTHVRRGLIRVRDRLQASLAVRDAEVRS